MCILAGPSNKKLGSEGRFIPRGHANSLCNGLNFSLVIG